MPKSLEETMKIITNPDLSYREMARRLGCTLGYVYTLRHKHKITIKSNRRECLHGQEDALSATFKRQMREYQCPRCKENTKVVFEGASTYCNNIGEDGEVCFYHFKDGNMTWGNANGTTGRKRNESKPEPKEEKRRKKNPTDRYAHYMTEYNAGSWSTTPADFSAVRFGTTHFRGRKYE